MRPSCFLLPVLLLLISCAGQKHFVPGQKYAPAQLQEDLDVAWKTYQQNHPSYDWYTPRDSVDARFAQVRRTLTDSLTENEFRVRLNWAVAAIRCGHTSVSPSKAYSRYADNHREPGFPLSLKVWGPDSMVVVQNLLRMKDTLTRGSVIHSINGVPASQLIRQMKDYVSPDGFGETFQEQVVSMDFGPRFKMLYGLPGQYNIVFTDTLGLRREAKLGNVPPRQRRTPGGDSARERGRPLPTPYPGGRRPPSYGQLRIDSSEAVALMQLNTFAHAKLRRFIKTGFRTLHKTSVKHLVIDLRNNGGGRINKSALLARYISDHPFRMADSVSANRLRFPYPGRVTHHLLYTWFGPFFTYKGADGRRHMGTLERNWHQPKKKHHFDGQVYVIAGGFTFSAATMFISALGQQPNITGVGEETGGGARGNSSVMTPMVVLPNTGVRAWLPLFRIVSRVDLPQNGRGVMPQVPVPPSAWHITRGRDPKMDKVMQLITERKAAGAVQHP